MLKLSDSRIWSYMYQAAEGMRRMEIKLEELEGMIPEQFRHYNYLHKMRLIYISSKIKSKNFHN